MKKMLAKVGLAVLFFSSLSPTAQLVSPTSGQLAKSKKVERSSAKSTNDLNCDPALAPFYHGVASGDLPANRVIIRTCRTPSDDALSYPLGWQMATDTEFENVVRQGQLKAMADVGQLSPETTYYFKLYDFTSETFSLIGRTRTALQDDTDHLRFAVVSCQNYQAGYFNALVNDCLFTLA